MRRYVDWVRERALPVWSTAGFDVNAGRFVECLDGTGRPMPVAHRSMVQARQIYVYAHAAALGWYPAGADLAERAMASLRRDYCDDTGPVASVAFSIDPHNGRIVSATRDSYTHAFVLFAAAHLYALNGDAALLTFARRLTTFVERELLDRVHGGVVDAIPAADTAKRQNPQMHLLEAYLALETAAPGLGYLERAGELVALFYNRMARVEGGVLLEHFSAGWEAHANPAMADVFEPGHHYEWAWLLDYHERLAHCDHHNWRETLYMTATRDGHAPSGLIYDEIDITRRVTKASHRLWPHTEAIKAAVARHRGGDADALAFARKMATLLVDHFLDAPFSGGWTDRLSPAGEATATIVPASSLYHLFLAASEAAAAEGPSELQSP